MTPEPTRSGEAPRDSTGPTATASVEVGVGGVVVGGTVTVVETVVDGGSVVVAVEITVVVVGSVVVVVGRTVVEVVLVLVVEVVDVVIVDDVVAVVVGAGDPPLRTACTSAINWPATYG